jgi:hypothetical protein
MDDKPQKQPRLHIRSVNGLLLPESIAITGNATALLQLRAQIERALRGEESYPFEESVYQDVNGAPFEVDVKWAKSKEEMEQPVPKPERTAEELPWAERARGTLEERHGQDEAG